MKKGLLLYQRIILMQIIAILIIMTLFSMYFFITNWNKELNHMNLQTSQLSERLAGNLSVPMWDFNSEASAKLLLTEIQNPYVIAIIIEQGGSTWLGKIKNGEDDILDFVDTEINQHILKHAYAVIHKKVNFSDTNEMMREIGRVSVYVSDTTVRASSFGLLIQSMLQIIILVFLVSIITFFILRIFLNEPLKQITTTATRIASGELGLQAKVAGPWEIATLARAFNSMTSQLVVKAEGLKSTNMQLTEIISLAKEIILKLNSTSKEIEAASQEQTSAANEQASGITEVSATLEELTITAKQITKNVGELVFASEESVKSLQESEKSLLQIVDQLEEVGKTSANNTAQIGELGKRSAIINEMVELIKEVANKTNILSINASIEASRSGEAGSGFSVVAAEIRELSKETITSAKKVEEAARQIQNFLNAIIIASESESVKVLDIGRTIKSVFSTIDNTVTKIKNNYSFTQKIDVSIKQQENGSKQAADTMRQMSEIARQSAETTRQTLVAVKDIVNYSLDLENTVKKIRSEEEQTE